MKRTEEEIATAKHKLVDLKCPYESAELYAKAAIEAADQIREQRQVSCRHIRKAGSSQTDAEGNTQSYWYCPDCGKAEHTTSWQPPETLHSDARGMRLGR